MKATKKEKEDAQWNEKFKALLEYKAEKYKSNPKLRYWVINQRRNHRYKNMSQDRVRKLEKIAFDWNPGTVVAQKNDEIWNEMFEELKAFKGKNYKQNPKLGSWVNEQRRIRRNKKMSQDRIDKLEEIGFLWKPAIGRRAQKNRCLDLGKSQLSDAASQGDATDANMNEMDARNNELKQSQETITRERDATGAMLESRETVKDSSGFVFNEDGIAANVMAFLNFEELQYLLCTHRMFSTDCKWKMLCEKHHNLEDIPPEYEGVAWYKVYWHLVENKKVRAKESDDLLEWALKILKSNTTQPVMKIRTKVSRAQKDFDFDIDHVMKVDAGQGFALNKTLLVMAAIYNRVHVVEWLVNEMKASVNSCVDDQEFSPLIYAAQRGNSRMVEFLLSKGADLRKAASFGFMKDAATGRLFLSRIHEALDAEEWARKSNHYVIANFIQNKKVEYENKILKEEINQLRASNMVLKNK
eukprot:scaffold60906_cov61-Cyclotella_meneghiniana.AAC.4